jgi:hypothetical protein
MKLSVSASIDPAAKGTATLEATDWTGAQVPLARGQVGGGKVTMLATDERMGALQLRLRLVVELEGGRTLTSDVSSLRGSVIDFGQLGAAVNVPPKSDSPVVSGKLSIADMVSTSAEQIGRAQVAMRTQAGAFQLGAVSMQLKFLPTADGGASFPEADAAIDPARFASLGFTLHPTAAPLATTSSIATPRLLGYTEGFARERASAAGVVVDVSQQTVVDVSNGVSQVGRVVWQSPGPGTMINAGSTVQIAIGMRS